MCRLLVALVALLFSAATAFAQSSGLGNGVWIGNAPGGGGGNLSFFGSPVINDLTKVYSSTQITNAIACTDYPSPPIGTSILAGDGSGCFANVTVGSGLTFIGGTLAATGGGGGSVTSVGLTAPGIFTVSSSPVTTSGTLGLGLATETANMVWAGPTFGGAATPTFRSLVAADLPADIAYIDKNQAWTASESNPPTTLTPSGATYTPNFNTGQNFYLQLVHASCPCTLANPSTSLAPGQTGVIVVQQSSSGNDTIGTYGGEYIASGGTGFITLSTGVNAVDAFSYYVSDSSHVILSLAVSNATH